MEKDSFYKGNLLLLSNFGIDCRDCKPKPYLKDLEVATFEFVLRHIYLKYIET